MTTALQVRQTSRLSKYKPWSTPIEWLATFTSERFLVGLAAEDMPLCPTFDLLITFVTGSITIIHLLVWSKAIKGDVSLTWTMVPSEVVVRSLYPLDLVSTAESTLCHLCPSSVDCFLERLKSENPHIIAGKSWKMDPLVNVYRKPWKISMFNGKTHSVNGPFSIANYQITRGCRFFPRKPIELGIQTCQWDAGPTFSGLWFWNA